MLELYLTIAIAKTEWYVLSDIANFRIRRVSWRTECQLQRTTWTGWSKIRRMSIGKVTNFRSHIPISPDVVPIRPSIKGISEALFERVKHSGREAD
jgi:hypothetical protein